MRAIALITFAIVTNVEAGVVTYANKQAWLTAAGPHTRITFQGYPASTFVCTQYHELGVVFTDGADLIRFLSAFQNDGVGLYGAYSAIHMDFASPAHVLGCELVNSANVRIYWQGQLVFDHFFQAHGGGFAGIVSDAPFDAAIIVDVSGNNVNIDDLYFGPPFTGSVSVKPVTRIAHVGQTVMHDGNLVTLVSLNSPATNNLGQVAFNGDTSVPGDSFIWLDDGIVFRNSDKAKATLTGAETQMGINDAGQFVYSPFYNGLDSTYSSEGLLFATADPIPGLPGAFADVILSPAIVPDGRAYWWTNYNVVPGGPEVGRAILTCPDLGNPLSRQVAIKSGDIIDGFPISPTGIYTFDLSGDGSNWLQYVRLTSPDENRDRLLLNGVVAIDEVQPSTGNHWDSFADICVNNHGDISFSGAMFGEQILVNDLNVVLRDGDVVDGVALRTGVRANSINNIGKNAVEWNLAPAGAGVFYGNADDMLNAACLLKIGDMIDYTGDGVADAGITWLNAQTQDGPGITLSDHDFVFIEATLLDVGSNDQYEAILRLDTIPLGNCPVDINASGAVDTNDLVAVILGWGPCPQPCPPRCVVDITANCAVDVDDLVAVILNWGACP